MATRGDADYATWASRRAVALGTAAGTVTGDVDASAVVTGDRDPGDDSVRIGHRIRSRAFSQRDVLTRLRGEDLVLHAANHLDPRSGRGIRDGRCRGFFLTSRQRRDHGE